MTTKKTTDKEKVDQKPADLRDPVHDGRSDVTTFDTPATDNYPSSRKPETDRPHSDERMEGNPDATEKEKGFANERDIFSDEDYDYPGADQFAEDEGFDPQFLSLSEEDRDLGAGGVTLECPYYEGMDTDQDGDFDEPDYEPEGVTDEDGKKKSSKSSQRSPKEALEYDKWRSRNDVFVGVAMCQRAVRTAYNLASASGFGSANEAWNSSTHKHRAPHQSDVPRGAPVYFQGSEFGHVALSAGGGLCWSTDVRRPGMIDIVSIGELADRWNMPLRGWTEDECGKIVWTEKALGEGHGGGHAPAPKHKNEEVKKAIKHLEEAAKNARHNGHEELARQREHFVHELRRKLT